MKVLIISHNPISSYQSVGKTILSLFSTFSRDELCQLYIYPTLPEIDCCTSYYRITDKDVLKSYYKFSVKGKEYGSKDINPDNRTLFENVSDEKLYRNRKNKRPFRMLMRDFMWRCAHWYNKRLKQWLTKEKPTCIFVAPGTAKFLYDIALKISNKLEIPIVTYICDEYYFVKTPNTILGRRQVNLLKKKIESLINHSEHLVVICEELKEAYFNKFAVPTTVIMTGSNYQIANSIKPIQHVQCINYFGNIRCNRYLSLAEMGREIDVINEDEGTDFKLNIYTSEHDDGILKTFFGIKSIQLCGFVSGEEFRKAFLASDILLHVEAFDEESIDFVQHSISTKIADSLGSGIVLLAYGPNEVASIQHLKRNRCALCATNPQELKDILHTVFFEPERASRFAERALKVANTYHDCKNVSGQMYDLMKKVNECASSQVIL